MTSYVPPHITFVPTAPAPKLPYRCPICGGCGTVPGDFYTQTGMATGTNRETCKACSGRGIVIA